MKNRPAFYIGTKAISIILCTFLLLISIPTSVFAVEEEPTSTPQDPLTLFGSNQNGDVTTTDNINPLGDNTEWFVLNSQSGLLMDDRTFASNVQCVDMNFVTGTVAQSNGTESLINDNAKYVQATSFGLSKNGGKDHVAYCGFFKVNGEYETRVYISEPDGDGLASPLYIRLGRYAPDHYYTCKYMDSDPATSDVGGTWPVPVGDREWYNGIVSGDFDGDGVDSLIVYFAYDEANYGLYEIKYKDRTIGVSAISTIGLNPDYLPIYNAKYNDNQGKYLCERRLGAKLAAGDLNGDGIDDLAVISQAPYINFYNTQGTADPKDIKVRFPYLACFFGAQGKDILTNGFNESNGQFLYHEMNCRRWEKQTSESSSVIFNQDCEESFFKPGIAIGDFDNDNRNEIVVGGVHAFYRLNRRTSEYGYDTSNAVLGSSIEGITEHPDTTAYSGRSALIAQYGIKDGTLSNEGWALAKPSSSAFLGSQWGSRGSSIATSVKWNGLGTADLFFLDGALYDLSNGLAHTITTVTDVMDFVSPSEGQTYDRVGEYVVQAGNFDGNPSGKESLAVAYMYASKTNDYKVSNYQQGVQIIYKNASSDSSSTSIGRISLREEKNKYLDQTKGYGSFPVLAAYDMNSKLVKMRYTGDLKCVYSNPTVVAVLEAAPYFSALPGTLGSTSYSITTTYGFGRTSGENTSTSVSMSNGFSAKTGFLGISPVHAYVSDKMYSTSFTNSLTRRTTNTFTSVSENSVVILRIPNYVYYYETDSGESMSIMVPQKPSYTQVTVAAYNEFAKDYNAKYVLTDAEREKLYVDTVAAYNEAHPDNPIDPNSEIYEINKRNFIDTKVRPLNLIELGEDGDLPANNLGNPWAYTGANFNYGDCWFSDSSAELGYDGGKISIGAAQVEDQQLSKEERNTQSVSASCTANFASNVIPDFLDIGFSCGWGESQSTTHINGQFNKKGEETAITGTVTSPSTSNAISQYGISADVLNSYNFTWQFGYWYFTYTEGENNKVPVVGYKVANQIFSPLDPPYNLAITEKYVNSDNTANLILSWDYTQEHGSAAEYFYIMAEDMQGNAVDIYLPGGEVTEYFGIPAIRVNATDATQYSVALEVDREESNGTICEMAKFHVISADSTNNGETFAGTSVPSEIYAMLIKEGLNGKSAYEIAVEEGYSGTKAEWLKSLVGPQGPEGQSAYELAVEKGYVGTEEAWLKSLVGPQGPEGKSAYELAVEKGYTGTIDEWLLTLKGEKGDTGEQGEQGEQGETGQSAYELAVEKGYTGTEDEWLESLIGSSAYNVALENGFEGTVTEWLESLIGPAGAQGEAGQSAYELAVEKGYTGTEEAWLLSLAGKDGRSAYQVALDSGFTGTEKEWLESLKGKDGRNAYQVAVDSGFTGTQTEWLESLKGKDGTPGKDGADGRDGINGSSGNSGANGRDGQNGKDGTDGQDGKDGADGVSIEKVYIDDERDLMVELTNGKVLNAGSIIDPNVEMRLSRLELISTIVVLASGISLITNIILLILYLKKMKRQTAKA